ncbi:MAG TPA: tandem-95 repeat protein [Bdellovibrionota bacterium]|jgi:hypothetical protein|nr:tandem-95 repeat protein [Bdellovibrionota bacterium]
MKRIVALILVAGCNPLAETNFNPKWSPGVSISSTESTLSFAASSLREGELTDVSLHLRDQNGRDYISDLSELRFELIMGSSEGDFSTFQSNGDGTYSGTFTGTLAGTPSKYAIYLDQSKILEVSESVQVLSRNFSLSNSVVTTTSTSLAAGTDIAVTLTMRDDSGNLLTEGGLSVTFFTSGGQSTGVFSAVTDHNDGTYTATFSGRTAGTATSLSARIAGVALTSAAPSVTVTPGVVSLTASTVSASSTSLAKNGTALLTIHAEDDYGNAVVGAPNITPSLSSGAGLSTGSFSPTTADDQGDGTYTSTFTANAYGSVAVISASVQGIGTITDTHNITVTNSAPTLTSASSLSGAFEDTDFSISYSDLASAANEADLDGDTLHFRVEALSTGTLTKGGFSVVPGTTTLSSGETLVWRAIGNASGTLNAFTIKAYDGSLYSSSAVQVQAVVSAVNDTPVANALSFSTNEDTTYTSNGTTRAHLSGSDTEGSSLSCAKDTDPSSGSVTVNTNCSFSYTPSANYNGSDSFTYTVNDGTISSSAVTVSITVSAVNDTPVADALSFSTNEDTTYASNGTTRAHLSGSDVEGPSLTCTKSSDPSHGSVTVNSNCSFSYTPTANYNGSDSFDFTVSDGSLSSSAAAVSITVSAVNDAPVANADTRNLYVNTPIFVYPVYNDSDVDGDNLTVSAVSGATNGTATLVPNNKVVLFTPTTNFTGTASFTYTLSDGTATSNATVTFSVIANTTNSFIASGATGWKYRDNGAEPPDDAQSDGWQDLAFDDSAWSSGQAILGYGSNGEVTTVSYGGNATNKYITTYFRKSFNVSNASTVSALTLQLQLDDGAVAYINGVEVGRVNMPSPGAITNSTLASTAIANETAWNSISVSPSLLVDGANVLAISLHQNAANSSDLSIDAKLDATTGGYLAKNSSWKYHNLGTDLSTSWITDSYNDTSWSSGSGILGVDTDFTPNTTIGIGPVGARYPTVYFRKSISLSSAPTNTSTFVVNLATDDGSVLYINGQEVIRYNLPSTTLSYNSLASSAIAAPNENAYTLYQVDPFFFQNGTNQLAAEVHQSSVTSSDLAFDAALMP